MKKSYCNMENYEEKLREIINNNSEYYPSKDKAVFAKYFPELKESEDKRIRQELCDFLRDNMLHQDAQYFISWLEKQGEKKPADKPKFKVGDWVLNNVCFPIQIASIENGMYIFTKGDAISISFVDENYHLWTIADAMDGDVIVCNINKAEIGSDVEKLPNMTPTIFIYQKVVKDFDYIHSYCSLYNRSSLRLQNTMYYNAFVCNIHPATKEQRDLLFQKIEEAGCKWDSAYKKLAMR